MTRKYPPNRTNNSPTHTACTACTACSPQTPPIRLFKTLSLSLASKSNKPRYHLSLILKLASLGPHAPNHANLRIYSTPRVHLILSQPINYSVILINPPLPITSPHRLCLRTDTVYFYSPPRHHFSRNFNSSVRVDCCFNGNNFPFLCLSAFYHCFFSFWFLADDRPLSLISCTYVTWRYLTLTLTVIKEIYWTYSTPTKKTYFSFLFSAKSINMMISTLMSMYPSYKNINYRLALSRSIVNFDRIAHNLGERTFRKVYRFSPKAFCILLSKLHQYLQNNYDMGKRYKRQTLSSDIRLAFSCSMTAGSSRRSRFKKKLGW